VQLTMTARDTGRAFLAADAKGWKTIAPGNSLKARGGSSPELRDNAKLDASDLHKKHEWL